MSRFVRSLRVHSMPGSPVVSIRFFVPGGARIEPTLGLAALLGSVLPEGTLRRDRFSLVSALDDRGIAMEVAASLEGHGLAVDTPVQHWRFALDLALEVLFEPALPQERVDWARAKQQSDLEALADEPGGPTAWRFVSVLAPGARSSFPLAGSHDSLEQIDSGDLKVFHQRVLTDGFLLSVAGDCDAAECREAMAEQLSRVELAVSPRAPLPAKVPLGSEWLPPDPAQQVHLYLGRRSVRRTDPDLVPLALASVALGAGPGLQGRIPRSVREQAGLAYLVEVAAAAGAGLEPGRFEVHLVTSPQQVDKAQRLVEAELRRVASVGLSHEELEAARRFVLGAEPFRRETAPQNADLLLDSAFYGQPYDNSDWVRQRVESVTLEDVSRVSAIYLDPESMTGVRGGGPGPDMMA